MNDQKFFRFNKEDEVFVEYYKKMCQDKFLRTAKLSRGEFKAFLQSRYKGAIGDKITAFFSTYFAIPMTFDYFCEVFERFINFNSRMQKLFLLILIKN